MKKNKNNKNVIKWVSHEIVIDFQCDFIIWSPSHPKLIFMALLWFWYIVSLTYNRDGVLHRWVHAVVLRIARSSSTQMVPRVFEEHGAWPAVEKRSCPLISAATPVQSPSQHFQPLDWLIQLNVIRKTSSDRKDTRTPHEKCSMPDASHSRSSLSILARI